MASGEAGVIEQHRDGYMISTDAAKLDLDVIHGFLSQAYWCEGIPRQTLERGIRNSLCFGVYVEGRQVGFARVISDRPPSLISLTSSFWRLIGAERSPSG